MMTVFLIFFPLAVALLIFGLRLSGAKFIAFGATVIQLMITLWVAAGFSKDATLQYAFTTPWIQSIGLQFSVGMDGIGMVLVLLTNLLIPFIVLSSFRNEYDKPWTFYGLILIMQMALVGVFTSFDGLLFYLFWEVALIPIYFICLIWGGQDRGRITFKFFVYTLGGSLLMLVALLYLYYQTPGAHSFDHHSRRMSKG
jgi:NADH-quinone oxidoreductase subunit M